MGKTTQPRATLEDLYRTEGKAELINGRIVPLMPTGVRPNEIAGNIYVSLRQQCKQTGKGHAFTDNLGYGVPELPSGRESLSPDASYYNGQLPPKYMRFVEGPPTLAVEVRSENDYGQAAEEETEIKRRDYFFAGTLVVWDVDPQAETVAVYRSDAPDQAVIFRKGTVAEAEPAVPGWTIAVDEVFA
jgi:Uma2 family endonuclease